MQRNKTKKRKMWKPIRFNHCIPWDFRGHFQGMGCDMAPMQWVEVQGCQLLGHVVKCLFSKNIDVNKRRIGVTSW